MATLTNLFYPPVTDIQQIVFNPNTLPRLQNYQFTSIQNLHDRRFKYESTRRVALLLVVMNIRNASSVNPKNSVHSKFGQKSTEKSYDRTISVLCPHSAPGRNAALILIKSLHGSDVFSSNLAARDNRNGFGPGALVVVKMPNPVVDVFGTVDHGIPIIEFSGKLLLIDTVATNVLS
jgi:hypothetical protein